MSSAASRATADGGQKKGRPNGHSLFSRVSPFYMTTTNEIVTSFYARIESKDFDGVRKLLHDDLQVQDPMGDLDSADKLIGKLTQASSVTESFRMKHVFVDGDRASCVYDLITATPIRESRFSEYFEIREGRIASIRVHYDSQPWIALYAEHSG